MPKGKFSKVSIGERIGYLEPVYDLVDVESGNCFMVRPAGGGAPQIVHNCSQALAACVFNHMHHQIEQKLPAFGGVFVGSVHDEIIASFPIDAARAGLNMMLHEMSRPVPFWESLVTFAEGDTGHALLERMDGSIDFKSRYGCLK